MRADQGYVHSGFSSGSLVIRRHGYPGLAQNRAHPFVVYDLFPVRKSRRHEVESGCLDDTKDAQQGQIGGFGAR